MMRAARCRHGLWPVAATRRWHCADFAVPATLLARLRDGLFAVRGSAPGSARRAGHFHLLAQMKVTKAKSLG